MKKTKKVSAVGTAIPMMDDKWRVEEDLRTLLVADEIREDSARMAAVRKLAKEKRDDIGKIILMPDQKPEAGDNDEGE
jgi:hypothetical protein